MKIYSARVPHIAKAIIESLCEAGDIEVTAGNREEAAKDLIAILEEYLRRDRSLREAVKEQMARQDLSYEMYGRTRSQLAAEWEHPLGSDVEHFLSRQFVSMFMLSRFVDEVYCDDAPLKRKIRDQLRALQKSDEAQVREKALERMKNVDPDGDDYEIVLRRRMDEVRRELGLM